MSIWKRVMLNLADKIYFSLIGALDMSRHNRDREEKLD